MNERRDMGFRPQFGHVPVKVGDEIEVHIEAVGEKGDGIAKVEGFVLFIPDTKEGDTVKVRITKVLTKVGFAEVVGESQGEPKEAAGEAPAEEAAEEAPEEAPSDTEDFSADTEDFGEESQEEPEEKEE